VIGSGIEEVNLVLLRHGRAQADDECVHEGRYDSPLSDIGREQARRRAQEWRERGVAFDRIVTARCNARRLIALETICRTCRCLYIIILGSRTSIFAPLNRRNAPRAFRPSAVPTEEMQEPVR
jgi:bisphosphoglycerate-dependent phosphoglycerate mutase